MASFVPADVQNEKVLLQMEISFYAYAIDVCLRREKNRSPRFQLFVSQVPIVQLMDTLLYFLAHCSLISKLIIEHTPMCTFCLCVHRVDI